ncbi:MAG: hypothetical protein HN738_08415 [Gammaproteobacteria bacterium]|jgi:hypothetical protein|nr:hypothetical protein [Gammaproteobacteria bacterium]
MKVELKNLKHSEFASRETNCFEATVWLNGKRAFFASNDGHGGADYYAPLENQERSEFNGLLNDLINHCLTLPKWGSEFGGEDSMDVTPEILIGNLVNDTLDTKKLKKSLKKKVLFINENGIYQTGYRGNRKVDQNLIDMVKDENPDSIILNCLAFSEALALYRGNHA